MRNFFILTQHDDWALERVVGEVDHFGPITQVAPLGFHPRADEHRLYLRGGAMSLSLTVRLQEIARRKEKAQGIAIKVDNIQRERRQKEQEQERLEKALALFEQME